MLLKEPKTICFTGKLTKFSRDDARGLAQRAGFAVAMQVSKYLNILVCADKNGNSNKLKRAKSLGITLWDEDKFLKACGAEQVEKKEHEVNERKSKPITWELICRKACKKLGFSVKVRKGYACKARSTIDNIQYDYNSVLFSVSVIASHEQYNIDVDDIVAATYHYNDSWSGVKDKDQAFEYAVRILFETGHKTSLRFYNHIKEIEDKLRALPQFEHFDSADELKMLLTISGWFGFEDFDDFECGSCFPDNNDYNLIFVAKI